MELLFAKLSAHRKFKQLIVTSLLLGIVEADFLDPDDLLIHVHLFSIHNLHLFLCGDEIFLKRDDTPHPSNQGEGQLNESLDQNSQDPSAYQ